MGNRYIAGLDIGTTGVKAAIFDLDGNIVGSAYREYNCNFPKSNWVEQDPDFLALKAMETSREAIVNFNINPKDIASLGISTQRSCTNFIDKKGNLLRPMISWMDSRCTTQIEEILKKISYKDFYEITGFKLNIALMLPEILWVFENEKQIWEKTDKIIQLQDYILRVFGVDGFINDVSDTGFYGIWDTNNYRWSQEILDLFDLDESLFPIPTPSCTKVGTISKKASEDSGFMLGMPICVGAGDQNSAAVGAGVIDEGYASISMGTGGNLNVYLDKAFRDPSQRNYIVNHAIYGKWQIEGHQAGAAGVYRWFRDEIANYEKIESEKSDKNAYKLLDLLIDKTPVGAKGLVFLPYLASAAAPRWNHDARGVLAGLSFSHDRGCLARAFLEGITLDMKDILESILNSGIEIKNVRLTGGATKSSMWNQIQSDVYNIEVETLKVPDAAVLGAAIMGGVGVGLFNDIREGADALVRIDKKYEPKEKNNEIYNDLYEIYCRIYDGIEKKDVFKMLAKMQKEF